MLVALSIRDIVLIDKLDLEFGRVGAAAENKAKAREGRSNRVSGHTPWGGVRDS